MTATDYYGNATTQSATFNVIATVQSLKAGVNRFYAEGQIPSADMRDGLLDKLDAAQANLDRGNLKAARNSLDAFIKSAPHHEGI